MLRQGIDRLKRLISSGARSVRRQLILMHDLAQHKSEENRSPRLFRVEELDNLALASTHRDQSSPAALALIKPAIDTGIRFERTVAEQVAADVGGYPYFIQKYGESLWDAADAANLKAVSSKLYASTRARVQEALDAEFFENRPFVFVAVAQLDAQDECKSFIDGLQLTCIEAPS